MRTCLPAPTDKSTVVTRRQQSRRRTGFVSGCLGWISRFRRREARSADLGSQLADDVADLRRHFDALARVLAVEHLGGQRQLEVLDDAGPSDAEGLAGLVVCPHAAVLPRRRADDGERLGLERAVSERP